MIQGQSALGLPTGGRAGALSRAGNRGQHRPLVFLNALDLSQRRPAAVRHLLARLLSPHALIEGVDSHLADPSLFQRAATAGAFVMTLPPLGNLSNGFYTVHPRRNDRFVAARAPLKALFPEVDFTRFAFTGELLCALAATCPVRFVEMRRDLTGQWLARMDQLLSHMPPRGVLLDPIAAPWLARPALPNDAYLTRLAVDPQDQQGAAAALIRATRLSG